MSIGTFNAKSRRFTLALAAMTAVLVFSIILFPEQAFQSSLNGLNIWWNVVFPSLLPFLIIGELMAGFGAVHALGTLMEPLMRPLFRIPGAGGWAIALGSVAGMPAGAEVAGKLRLEKRITREEGERLLAVSHVASPFFILAVIGVGFLHSAETGAAIAIIHYLSALGTGLLLRFGPRGARKDETQDIAEPLPFKSKAYIKEEKNTPLLLRAYRAMHAARLKDGRSLGKLLGDAVTRSIQTLMMVGGYMIVFSVILGVLETVNLYAALQSLLSLFMPEAVRSGETLRSAAAAMMEQHVGAYRFGNLPYSDRMKAAWIGAALGWSGFAVHFQVQTIIRGTDLRYKPFLVSRFVHAAFAFVLTFVLWNPLTEALGRLIPGISPAAAGFGIGGREPVQFTDVWMNLPERLSQLLVLIACLLLISAVAAAAGKFRKG
jgi:sporulation integral membrane protein YlbJ